MTKKKKSQVATSDAVPNEPRVTDTVGITPEPQLPSKSIFMIRRHKSLRYISAYQGKWLDLPIELLESFAIDNYLSPRPHPIDPALVFDLVKIRHLTEEATNLSLRAANGTTASFTTNPHSSVHGYINAIDAEILGLSYERGGGTNAKLSRERKFRIREHATTRLAHAYCLDELAASLAAMQSASTLNEVAQHVLLRNEGDAGAQYVRFFHETIPGRFVAANTPLEPLTEIIRQRPTEAAHYRTRAATRILKDDFVGSANDLTEALAVHRLYSGHCKNNEKPNFDQAASHLFQGKLDESDHTSTMEPQLLFLRAGVYLTLACHRISEALSCHDDDLQQDYRGNDPLTRHIQQCLEGRKLVRMFAKKALRDYTAFLSHFEYTPDFLAECGSASRYEISPANAALSGQSRNERPHDDGTVSQSEVSRKIIIDHRPINETEDKFPGDRGPPIYKVSELFSSVAPSDVPPFPSNTREAEARDRIAHDSPSPIEVVTYHPLMIDVLHSLLLCHCLIRTSDKELKRHAYMVARIARISNSYPLFLPPSSPSRADWIIVLRRTKNWLGLEHTWEDLCSPFVKINQHHCETQSDRDGQPIRADNMPSTGTQSESTKEESLSHVNQNMVLETVPNAKLSAREEAIASVRARYARSLAYEDEEMRKDYHSLRLFLPKPTESNATSSPNKGKKISSGSSLAPHYPSFEASDDQIVIARCDLIARWILEAPPPGSSGAGSGTSRVRTKTKKKKHGPAGAIGDDGKQMKQINADITTTTASSPATNELEQSIKNLEILDKSND